MKCIKRKSVFIKKIQTDEAVDLLTDREINFFIEEVQNHISPNRFKHSLEVADSAYKLAKYWGAHSRSAYLAGLLHDAAKNFDLERLKLLNFPDQELAQDIWQEYPLIWHAFIAPGVLKRIYNVHHPSIINAVKWHTTGKAKMSTLTKILFVADFIEPGRNFENQKYFEELAYQDLNATCFAIILFVLFDLLFHGKRIHYFSFACYNYYLKQIPPKKAQAIKERIIKDAGPKIKKIKTKIGINNSR